MKFAVFLFRKKEGGVLVTDFMLVSNHMRCRCDYVATNTALLLLTQPARCQVKGSETVFVTFVSGLIAEVTCLFFAAAVTHHIIPHITSSHDHAAHIKRTPMTSPNCKICC